MQTLAVLPVPAINDTLPDNLKSIRTRPMFVMRLDVAEAPRVVGQPPPHASVLAYEARYRCTSIIRGGFFEGDRLSGKVLDGGSDWQTVRHDGSVTLNAKLILRTSDNALVSMMYQGVRHGPADVIARLESGETVDPKSYYFRTTTSFQTSAPQYDWLNRVIGLGIGHRLADGPIYSIFELL